MTDGRKVRGQRSREAILATAVELASVDGLDGLSLSKLAAAAGMSKSGFFSHWRDKTELQLDAVEWAAAQWRDRIVVPALRRPRGVRRLFALHEERLRFYAEGVLPGGCFFFAAEAEFDDLPGPVRERIAEAKRDWHGLLLRVLSEAVAQGDLVPETDPELLVFEINAIGAAVVTSARLLECEPSFRHGRQAVLQRLRALATDPALLPED
ncbi:TetR family transcriptional regulator [Nonomuraea sp. NPDC050310]|uniref:TetR/AcrR family transcriptional regulator n=1 Tax=unclassified Nonomuraea TaxID=2593643 RepID=UPI0033FB9251